MGGTVAFAIKRDGKIQTREFGKSAVHALCSQAFFEGRGEIMEAWSHCPAQPFAPIQYGLIAVDFDAQWAGAIQGYAGVDNRIFFQTNEEGFRNEALELFEAGRLRGFRKEDWQVAEVAGSFDEFFEELRSYQKSVGSMSAQLLVDPPKGWVFEALDETENGWSDLVGKLLDLGWGFSDADMEAWVEFAKDQSMSPSIIGAAKSLAMREQLEKATIKPSRTHSRRF